MKVSTPNVVLTLSALSVASMLGGCGKEELSTTNAAAQASSLISYKVSDRNLKCDSKDATLAGLLCSQRITPPSELQNHQAMLMEF